MPNGSNKSRAEKWLFQVTGLKAGVWDVLFPYPCTNASGVHHTGLWIEFKAKGRTLSKEQQDFLSEVISQGGYEWITAFTWIEAARATLKHIGMTEEQIAEELKWSK